MPNIVEEEKKKELLRTWITVDTDAALSNYRRVRDCVASSVKFMAVVKSNAYGHGLVPFAMLMERVGVDMLGVDSITEAVALRRSGIRIPILILGHTLPSCHTRAVECDSIVTISSRDVLRHIIDKDIPLRAHIKVDSGMHRQGFLPHERDEVVAMVRRARRVRIEGVYTHFAAASSEWGAAYTREQMREVRRWHSSFRSIGIGTILHMAATAGTLMFPESHADMVRIGIGLYGIWPSDNVRRRASPAVSLRPALSWKSVISEVKRVPSGARVGYDLTATLRRDTTLAVIPVGYWHGYDRLFSNKGVVVVRGRRVPVIGRVSMDMTVVDVTSIAARVRAGDEVTLLGESVSADEMARWASTTPYEILTRINPKIHRFYE